MAEPGIDWEYTYEDELKVREYYCTKDRKVLWKKYMNNDVEVVMGSCEHFEWEPVGSGCYPDPMDEEICAGIKDLTRKAIKKIDDGTTTYFLIARD